MSLQRTALWAIVIAATIYLLVAGRGLLMPIVLGLALWYMVDALADTFEQPRMAHLRLPRPVALTAAVCVIGGLFWVLGRTIGSNVTAVIAAAPNYETRLQHLLTAGAKMIGVEQAPTLVELFERFSLADTLGGFATAAASVVSITGIVVIYAGFLFVEQAHFGRKLAIVFGEDAHQARVRAVLGRIDRDIRIYIRIKTALAAATSILGYAVMAWVGVDFAGFWAVLLLGTSKNGPVIDLLSMAPDVSWVRRGLVSAISGFLPPDAQVGA